MKKLHRKSGETLTEVLAASVVFLLMMGVMQGAISFCTNAQHKSEAIRRINGEICEKLRTAPFDSQPPVSSGTYSFKAVSADGQFEGSTVLFQVEAGLGTKSVDYVDETGTARSVTFYLFQPSASGGGGGGP